MKRDLTKRIREKPQWIANKSGLFIKVTVLVMFVFYGIQYANAQNYAIEGDTMVCSGREYSYKVNSSKEGKKKFEGNLSWRIFGGKLTKAFDDSLEVNIKWNEPEAGVTAKIKVYAGENDSLELPVKVDQVERIMFEVGSSEVCKGDTITYAVTNIPEYKYGWNFPDEWILLSKDSSYQVTVITSIGDSISVIPIFCKEGISASKEITVNKKPNRPNPIQGDTVVCQNAKKTYRIDSVKDATKYKWTLPDKRLVDTDVPHVEFEFKAAGSVKISVQAQNECGESEFRSLEIKVYPIPPTPEISVEPESLNPNQKGILLKVIGTYQDDVIFKWSRISGSGISSYMERNSLNYWIVNLNDNALNSKPEISVSAQNKICKSLGNIELDVKDNKKETVDNEFVEIRKKGEYILIYDTTIINDISWGYFNFQTDKVLLEESNTGYHDFYPDSVSINKLYFIQIADDDYVPSRYFYNIKMKPNGESSNSAIHGTEVYPNPSDGMIKIGFNDQMVYPCFMTFYDRQGIVIRKVMIDDPSGLPYTVNMQFLKPGIYFLNIIDSVGKKLASKFIIQK